MPVVTTVSTFSQGIPAQTITVTEYRVDVYIDRLMKSPTKLRGAVVPYNDALFIQSKDRFYSRPDNLVPNTPASGTRNFPVCPADRLFGQINDPNKWVLGPSSGPGTLTGNIQIAEFGENPWDNPAQNNNFYLNRYYILIPSANNIPEGCVIRAVCGYPFGTVKLIYADGGVYLMADTPPAGFIRNKDLKNRGAGIANYDAFQVSQAGFYSRQQLCVSNVESIFNARGAGFLDSALPALMLYQTPDPFGYPGLQGYNYQTSTVMRSNVTFTGRWRLIDHEADHSTYYAQPGAYLGAAFNIPYVDTTPTIANITIKPTFGYVLPVPALPSNKYCGLCLELSGSSDYVNSSGVTLQSTKSGLIYVDGGQHRNQPGNISFGYQPLPYWPWDMAARQYGPDDATVFWVSHAGYIPASVPTMAMTSVTPVFTRVVEAVGDVIVLQGGRASFTDPAPGRIEATTPPCTGIEYSTNGPDTNKTAATASVSIRIVSRYYSAEWTGSSPISGVTPEYDPVTPFPITGYRYACSSHYSAAGVHYPGPGVRITPIVALVANAVGLTGQSIAVATDSFTYPYNVPVSSRTIRQSWIFGDAVTAGRGSIQIRGTVSSREKITISDGTLTKTFEFDTGFGVVSGTTPVSGLGGINAVTAALVAAINASGLAITASSVFPTDLVCEVVFKNLAGQAGGFRQSAQRWNVPAP